jgi:hypothetical protein
MNESTTALDEDEFWIKNAEAISRLEATLRESKGLSRRATIRSCVLRWPEVVQRIEAGYEHGFDEYLADLSGRELIEHAINALPSELASWLRNKVEPWDERFRAATVPANKQFWKDGWWGRRLPIKRNEKLADQVTYLLP